MFFTCLPAGADTGTLAGQLNAWVIEWNSTHLGNWSTVCRRLSLITNNSQHQRGPEAMRHLRKCLMVLFHHELGAMMLVLQSWQWLMALLTWKTTLVRMTSQRMTCEPRAMIKQQRYSMAQFLCEHANTRTRSGAAPQLMAVDTPAEDDTSDTDDSPNDDDSRPEDPLALLKSDAGKTRHLKTNSECLFTLSKNSKLESFFNILARARNDNHLAVLEAIFIASYQPALCSQKDHVRCLSLF